MEGISGLFKRKSKKKDYRRRMAESARWNKTERAERRAKRSGAYYEEQKVLGPGRKYYEGRPIIGRDREINGGVYLGGGAREAIVVDDRKDPYLNQVYSALLKRRKWAERKVQHFKDGILEEVWALVKEQIPYNEQNVEDITNQLPEPDTKIYLSSFRGGGVCRHQALLAGYLLERLAKENYLGGKVSVDRNFVPHLGGHAWVRYTNSVGKIIIIDPAQDYLGEMDSLEDKHRWFYERPEDLNPRLRLFYQLKSKFLGI